MPALTFPTESSPSTPPLPPHLSMEEYIEFVADSLSRQDPAMIAKQKQIEEQIEVPFTLVKSEESL